MICAIDHHELANLVCLLDDIFHEKNRLGIVTVVNNPSGRQRAHFFTPVSEFMVVYARNRQSALFNPVFNNGNVQTDEKGMYVLRKFLRDRGMDISARTVKPQFWYPIYVKPDLSTLSLKPRSGWHKVEPITNNGQEKTWNTKADTAQQRIQANELVACLENDKIVIKYKYRKGSYIKTYWDATDFWDAEDYNSTTKGDNLLSSIIGRGCFQFPKSLYLLKDILKLTSQKDSIILDFFAGSGTTGHAVLELNAEDSGRRQCILATNNENQIAEKVTYARLKNVIQGYRSKTKSKEIVEGIPANLHYFKTDFVDKQKTNDSTRDALLATSFDMICIKENVFDLIVDEVNHKIFQNSIKSLIIISNSDAIEQCKQDLQKLDSIKPIHIYIFSYSNDSYESDFDDLRSDFNLHHEAIPEAILQVYRKIFQKDDSDFNNVQSGLKWT